jgi:hypothetical protein
MPVGPTLVTLNCGPKLDLTFATWAMSACEEVLIGGLSGGACGQHAGAAMTAIALGFDIAANVAAASAQPRNATPFSRAIPPEILPERGGFRRARIGDDDEAPHTRPDDA